ncbi:MAG: hypothetical protein CHACPFDD_00459 [Phycisphaerae bacterium]|nr:hypothetical protein [Phycisphaerae bacterium]
MDTTRPSLLLRIRDGRDQTAWVEFDALYRPILERFAAARGLRGPDVDDVVQHCMAAIHRHIGGFDYDPRRGRFRGWLATLANNFVRNLARRGREQPASGGAFELPNTREPSPDEAFERIWTEEHLRHCLRAVREQTDGATFDAFHRYAILEEPAEQVARDSGLTAQQLYKLKWRLTRRLREKLVDLLGEEEAAGAVMLE